MKFQTSRRFLSLLLALTLFTSLSPLSSAHAQAQGLYYSVQEGDTLTLISQYFHTTVRRILLLNNLTNADVLNPGRRIYIPGFEDLSGEIVRTRLAVGENAHTLSRALHQGNDLVERLNYLTSPDSLYAGQSFFQLKTGEIQQTRLSLTKGITAPELAVHTASNPWAAAIYNDLRGPWSLVGNDTLYLPGEVDLQAYLPSLSSITVDPSSLLQGKTTLIRVDSVKSVKLAGSLLGFPLHFFKAQGDTRVALQGIPRLAKTGLATLTITATLEDGRTFTHQQNLFLKRQDYGIDAPFQVTDNVIDPEITEPEYSLVEKITSEAPTEKMWSVPFQPPSPNPDCKTSTFGRLRSYNGSPFEYFHAGIDYCGNESTEILAPAPGIVVYTGSLTVRGNATIISHGWGVYTGYWHQSRIDVEVGDRVETGDRIGMVGNTGRVTGPHLHYGVIVGTVEVDPDDWFVWKFVDL